MSAISKACNITIFVKQSSILLLGSIALDTIETSFGYYENLLGGSATYASVSSSKFFKPNIVGVVGSDFSKKNMNILKNSCNNLENLAIEKGKTFRWGGKYFDNGDQRETLFTELGVFENYSPLIIRKNKNPSYIFLANIGPKLQLSVLDQCGSNSVVILDTMNLWIDIAKKDLIKVLNKTDILLINEAELIQLAKTDNFKLASKKIQSLGPSTIIVKHGSKGSVCYNGDISFSLGVIPNLIVKDPTGAGDSFGGGLVSALAQGLSLKEAMIRGTVMASFCIEDFGIKSLLKSKIKEIEDRSLFLSRTLKS